MSMNIWFLSAAILAAMTTMLHIFAGGRFAARPLLDAQDLSSSPKYTNYFCWHIVTIALTMLAFGYGYAAQNEAGYDVALIATVMAGLVGVWNLFLIRQFRLKAKRHPQFVFFFSMAILGLAGLIL